MCCEKLLHKVQSWALFVKAKHIISVYSTPVSEAHMQIKRLLAQWLCCIYIRKIRSK